MDKTRNARLSNIGHRCIADVASLTWLFSGTIDDNYPAALLYLWGNPELLNALLRPVNMFMRNETYAPWLPFPRNLSFTYLYSVHYLGKYRSRTETHLIRIGSCG